MNKHEIIKRHIFFPLLYYVQTWQREKSSAFSVCYNSGKKIHLPVSQWFLGGRLKIYTNLIEICIMHQLSPINSRKNVVFDIFFSIKKKSTYFNRKKKNKFENQSQIDSSYIFYKLYTFLSF